MDKVMVKSLLGAWIAAILLSGCGGGGGGGSTPSPGPTGRATGLVKQRANGQPVAGAAVTFGSRQGTTNAQGQYAIDGVPVGTSQVRVQASGFATMTQTLSTPIAAGDNAVPDVLMAPDAGSTQPGVPFSIQGRVTLSQQSDASGVTVAAVDPNSQAVVDQTQTGADGRYTLWVPPGSYRLRASHSGFTTLERSVTVADVNLPISVDFALSP